MHKRATLLLLPLFTACVADEPETSEIALEATLGPTTLTFYQHASLTGATLSVSLSSADQNERIRLVSKPDIEAAGLLQRVSAVRLRCGARDARVVLQSSWNASNTDFSSWNHYSGSGGTINCRVGQSVTVNLHDRFPALGDNVGSAFLTTHAENVGYFNFTDFFESAWAVALDQLPNEATAGSTDIWLTTTRTFHIRQRLRIDHWACTERGAVFEYTVRLMNDNTFRATVTDSYVDYGFGDLWECRDKMKASLDSAIAGARDDLEDGLQDLVDFLAPDHARYYWVPDVNLRTFDMFYGADPLENAPL